LGVQFLNLLHISLAPHHVQPRAPTRTEYLAVIMRIEEYHVGDLFSLCLYNSHHLTLVDDKTSSLTGRNYEVIDHLLSHLPKPPSMLCCKQTRRHVSNQALPTTPNRQQLKTKKIRHQVSE